MSQKKTFLIIDGNALVHRAFHALPLLVTQKKQPTNAVYGFLLIFLKTIRELKPDFIATAFDLPFPTFRHKQFKGYKAKRSKAPEELNQQFPIVKEILKAFEVPIFEKQGFEADDIIGTLSKESPFLCQGVEKGLIIENIILTGDLDTLQLIDKNTKVYTPKKGLKDAVLYDEKAVSERYGLEPEQLVDFKGLRGDPSDNIPGVPGIGEKTAAKLIKEFGSLENLYLMLGQKPLSKAIVISVNQRFQTLLEEYKDQAFFSKMLVKIKKDVPIDFDLEKCRFGKYNKEKMAQKLKNLEFYSLIRRLP